MSGLLPLLIALTIVETAVHGQREGAAAGLFAIVLPWGLLLWWLLCETACRLVATHFRTRQALEMWDIAAQVLAVGLFAGLCYGLGWVHRVHYYSLGLAPWMAAMAIHWWCMAVAVRAVGGAPWTRTGLLLHHLRFALLPLVVALPVLDVSAWIANSTHLDLWLFATFGKTMNVLGGSLLALGMVLLLPWVLVKLWGARPLADAALQDELGAACARSGVAVTAILRWPVRGGRVYNAMVIGVLPRLRYVLFTDDLLRDFPANERTAVLGHELGHARHHHLWIYLLFALATGLLSWSARGVLDDAITQIPLLAKIDVELRDGLIAMVLLAIQWRLLFGVLSRACERQADLAGAELAGDGDVRQGSVVMQRALASVARFAGIDPRAPSWRHHSIASRVAFLGRVGEDPKLAARHHQQVRVAVELLAAVTGVLLALATLGVI